MTAQVAGNHSDATPSDRYSDFAQILVEIRGAVAILTLNSNPERHNPINHPMMGELTRFFRAVREDRRVRAIVVTGAGKSFSSGGDVNAMQSNASETWLDRLPVNSVMPLVESILGVEQPVVAAVKGYAIGAGAVLALWSDIVIIAEDATIGDPHAKLGLTVPTSVVLMPIAIGMPRAKALLLTGRLVKGAEAAAMGLVARAVPSEAVMDEALRQAAEIAEMPPLSVQWTKRVLNTLLRRDIDALLGHSLALEGLSLMTADYKEAVEAFVNKRKPEFTGE